jgi:nitrogen fixation/metabolism regulation signal transduction histidine kinase
VERERERLAVILSRLSTGVLVVDRELRCCSANQSAGTILGGDLAAAAGQNLTELRGATRRALAQFVAELRARLTSGWREWREQLTLPGRPASACCCGPARRCRTSARIPGW